MLELFECAALSAKISKAQCERNRKRTDNHVTGSMAIAACKGCSGLGGAVKINTEGITMPEVKRKICDVVGCKNVRWKGGKCWSHHPEHIARREAKAVAVAPIPVMSAVEVAEVERIEVLSDMRFGSVVNGDGDSVPFGVDEVILQAIDDAFRAKRHDWIVDLSGMKPGRAICMAADMVRAAESLGY